MTLQWICDYCGEPVEDGKGYLTIPRDVGDMPARIKTWEAEPPGMIVTGAELMTYPSMIKWDTLHSGCDLGGHGFYDIEVERIRSSTQMLEWTAHLMEKRWLKYTDWTEVVRRVLLQLGVAA